MDKKLVVLVAPPYGAPLVIISEISEKLDALAIQNVWSQTGEGEIRNTIIACQIEGYAEITVLFADSNDGFQRRLAKAAIRDLPGVSLWAFSGRMDTMNDESIRYFPDIFKDGTFKKDGSSRIIEALKKEFGA